MADLQVSFHKDEGFLIFGVFENHGDCVSFVSTQGKNEPGKNNG